LIEPAIGTAGAVAGTCID